MAAVATISLRCGRVPTRRVLSAIEGLDELPVLAIPEPDGAIFATGDHKRLVATRSGRIHEVGPTTETAVVLAIAGFVVTH